MFPHFSPDEEDELDYEDDEDELLFEDDEDELLDPDDELEELLLCLLFFFLCDFLAWLLDFFDLDFELLIDMLLDI